MATLKAGVILINKDKVCLIYRDYYNDYSFPKGHLENNESLKHTHKLCVTIHRKNIYLS